MYGVCVCVINVSVDASSVCTVCLCVYSTCECAYDVV